MQHRRGSGSLRPSRCAVRSGLANPHRVHLQQGFGPAGGRGLLHSLVQGGLLMERCLTVGLLVLILPAWAALSLALAVAGSVCRGRA